MKYYKVKPEYDNQRLLNFAKHAYEGILVGNELYTEKELSRMETSGIKMNREKWFVPVEVSKRNVSWFFGARFQAE